VEYTIRVKSKVSSEMILWRGDWLIMMVYSGHYGVLSLTTWGCVAIPWKYYHKLGQSARENYWIRSVMLFAWNSIASEQKKPMSCGYISLSASIKTGIHQVVTPLFLHTFFVRRSMKMYGNSNWYLVMYYAIIVLI